MEEKEIAEMNVLPLVDVMLVLLTIVLTTATFVAKGLIPVELPAVEKSASALRTENQKSLVEITHDGKIFLDAAEILLTDLKTRTQTLPKDRLVLIRADKKIQLDLFIQVLSRLKKQGFTNISLQTEEKA